MTNISESVSIADIAKAIYGRRLRSEQERLVKKRECLLSDECGLDQIESSIEALGLLGDGVFKGQQRGLLNVSLTGEIYCVSRKVYMGAMLETVCGDETRSHDAILGYIARKDGGFNEVHSELFVKNNKHGAFLRVWKSVVEKDCIKSYFPRYGFWVCDVDGGKRWINRLMINERQIKDGERNMVKIIASGIF